MDAIYTVRDAEGDAGKANGRKYRFGQPSTKPSQQTVTGNRGRKNPQAVSLTGESGGLRAG